MAGCSGGWDVTCMVPLFITSDSDLTHPSLGLPSPTSPGGQQGPPTCQCLAGLHWVPASEGGLLGQLLWWLH